MRQHQRMDVHQEYVISETPPGAPPPLDWPSPAAPPAVARRGVGRRFGVAVAAMLLTAGVVVVGCAHGGTKTVAGRATAEQSQQHVVVTGPQLVKMWDDHPAVCGNPTGTKDEPQDPKHVMGDTPWPDRPDITPKLAAMTSTGSAEDINEWMQRLGIIVLRTQSDIVNHINKAAENPGKEASFTTLIQLRHDNYVEARDYVLDEIASGSPVTDSNTRVAEKYHKDWVCPDA